MAENSNLVNTEDERKDLKIKEVKCFNCGEEGHKVPQCKLERKKGRLPFDPRRRNRRNSRKIVVMKFSGGKHYHYN